MGRLFYLPLGGGEDVYGSALLFVAWRLFLDGCCVVQSGRWLISRRLHQCKILRMFIQNSQCLSLWFVFLFIVFYYIRFILDSC